jgi:hypothetical protein
MLLVDGCCCIMAIDSSPFNGVSVTVALPNEAPRRFPVTFMIDEYHQR